MLKNLQVFRYQPRDRITNALAVVLVEMRFHLELETVFALGVLVAGNDHLGVGEEDAVEGKTCALDGVLVHFL